MKDNTTCCNIKPIKPKNKIIEILMKRDGMSLEDATIHYKAAKAEINDAIANGDCDLVEDLMAEEFGLEPDYILDLL